MLTALDRRRGEDGFSLVEVLVALTLFALVAAALLPLLVLSGSAAVSSRSHTRAKNIAQERIELMRQLPFQVDIQNGPFIDLLDKYFPNRTAATGTGTGWVPATSTARLPGEPTTGSFYRTRFDSLAGQPGFRQVVAVQFLDVTRTPLADTRYATYQHNAPGRDAAPTTLLGVTVLTYWTHAGQPRSFRIFTQIGDPGSSAPLLSNSASATLMRLESALSPDVAVSSEVLSVSADGRLSEGSSSGVRAVAGRGAVTGAADLLAANGEAVDPATCTGTGCPSSQPGTVTANAVGACTDAVSFGRTRVTGLTSTSAGGRPRVPADITTVPASRASAHLLKETGSSCGAATFNTGIGLLDPRLQLAAGAPLVLVNGDDTSTGSTPVATSQVFVDATAETASTRYVRSGASTRLVDRSIRLFPTSFAPEGVMKITLSASQLTCQAGSAPSGSYTVRVQYWNGSGYTDLAGTGAFSWSSSSPTANPYASVVMGTKVVNASLGVTLADYVPSPPVLATALTTGSTNGVASLGDAVLSITTAPVRVIDPSASTLLKDPSSAIGVKVGLLSCVAVDER